VEGGLTDPATTISCNRCIEVSPRRTIESVERDGGPRQVRQIAVERHERAEGQPPVHDGAPARPQHDQHADAGDEPHQRRESGLGARQGEAAPQVLAVGRREVGPRAGLERVRAHDRHAAEIFLDALGQHAQLILGGLRPLVDHDVEAAGHHQQRRIRRQRPQREPRVDHEHRAEDADEGEERGHQADGAEAEERPDGGDVAGRPGHQIARRVRGVEPRRERLEGRIEIVPDIGLDPLTTAGDREARPEPRDAVDESEQRDEGGRRADRRRPGIGLQCVDRALDHPGNRDRREGGGAEAEDADGVARTVAPDVAPGRPRGRGQPRLPAACGKRAA
jgi:hypothetical protein